MAAIEELGTIVGGHIRLEEGAPMERMFQCFLTNSHGHYAESRVQAWREFGQRFTPPIKRIVHASYVTYPWSTKQGDVVKRSLMDLKYASECANILGLWGLNVHLPKEYHVLEGFTERLEECLENCLPPCKLLLEITGSSTRYVTEGRLPPLPIQRMKACQSVIEPIARRLHREDNWGFCLDTAHAFVQGQPLTTSSEVESMITDAAGVKILAIHLNGSLHPFRSGRDQHAETMSQNDYIWGEDHSGLKTLLQWIVRDRIPSVLERPGNYLVKHYDGEMRRLSSLLR